MGCPYLPYLGGSTKRLLSLSSEISKFSDIRQYLITPTLSSSDDDDLYFYDILRLKKINSRLFSWSTTKFIRKHQINIVVLHNSRVVLSWFLFFRFLFPKVKVLIEIHSFRDDSFLKKIINKILYKSSDGIVHLSESSLLYMENQYKYFDNYIVYNGINLKSDTKEKKVYNRESTVYGYIGSFHSWQGINNIVDNAINVGLDYWQYNELHLVGNGPEFDFVESKLAFFINSDAKIYIHGWKSSDHLLEIANEFDFLLAPRPSTIATETVFPLKIVDSINYNIPLICTDVGGLKEKLYDTNSAFYISKCEKFALSSFFLNKPTLKEYLNVTSNLTKLSKSLGTWSDSAQNYVEIFRCLENK
jgi:hypothetical protein